jgi:hypothetical protein
MLGNALGRLNPFKDKRGFTRAHQRYESCILGELAFTDRGFSLDGALREISIGGCLFRPSSVYILDRRNERVLVRFERVERIGTIMNARPQGYGIKFDEPMDMTELESLGGEFGLQPVEEFH